MLTIGFVGYIRQWQRNDWFGLQLLGSTECDYTKKHKYQKASNTG